MLSCCLCTIAENTESKKKHLENLKINFKGNVRNFQKVKGGMYEGK